MSFQRTSLKQQWIVLLILVQLLAILPARPVSAQQAGPCDDGSTAQASSADFDVPADDQPVQISKEEVNRAVFLANWKDRYTNAEEVLLTTLNGAVVAGGANFGVEWVEIHQKLLDEFNKVIPTVEISDQNLYSYDDILHTAFDVMLTVPETAHLVPSVWKEIATGSDSFLDAVFDGAGAKVSASAWRYSQAARMLASSSDIVARLHRCAQANPAVAAAFDQLHGAKLNASIGDDAMTILENNLDLAFPSELRGRIAEDGAITISLDELKTLGQGELDRIHASIDSMQDTLLEIDQQQKVIVDYLKNEELKAKHQQLMKQKAAEEQAKLDAAKRSITVLTSLLKKVDPQFAKEFNVVANSSMQMGLALNGWMKATAGLKGLDKVASMSTIVMTGNMISAVMNLVALFEEGRPTPEQMILEEIGRLRQQVSQLRTEMHGRFDRVDAGLNAIYTSMHDRFNQIDLQLGKIDGNVLELQQGLLSLELKLSQIERNNFELINAVGRRPFLNAVQAGLGYEKRTGLQMPYEPDFIGYENEFHSWGTLHAYDPGNAGPTQRDLSDAKVFEELNKYPLDLNLNYLNSWLVAHGLPAITDKHLASARDWLFAGRAYTQLGLEWPEHMKRVNEDQQKTLDKVGFEIDAAIRKISTQPTADGTIGNTLLFSSVITYYQGKLENLDRAVQQLENAYVNEIQFSQLQRAEPFNLFGDIQQPLTYVTPELTTATCANPGTHGSFPTTSNLRSLFPHFEVYNLADYLKLGKIAVCLKNELVGVYDDCPPGDEGQQFCITKGRNQASITVTFNDFVIMSQTITDGTEQLAKLWKPNVELNWTQGKHYKAQFEALSTIDPVPASVAAERAAFAKSIGDKVETTLAAYQKELYQRIIHEVTAGALKDMALEVSGGPALLSALTTLGLQRAVENDEFLHALLFGNQRLVDHNAIVQTYAISVTEPITVMNRLVNPRLVLWQTAHERTAAYADIMREYLDAITAGSHIEAAPLIANTRRALDLTMRIVRIELPQAPGETSIAGLQASGDSPTPLGAATAFTASVSAGTNVSFTWDFGDGKGGAGAHPFHIYDAPGVYSVRVTARNSVSQASADLQVVVEPGGGGTASQQLFLPHVNR